MNRSINLIFILTLVTLIVTVPLVTAQGNMPGPGHRHPPRPNPRNDFKQMDNRFEGLSEHMNVTGTISVEDAIILSILVSPTSDMVDRMITRANQMGHYPNISNFQNQMTVKLISLVEFMDLTDDGFSPDDTVISSYFLNSSTLNEVEFSSSSGLDVYIISSPDGVFNMTIEVNSTNNLPHDWKWSLEIDYPFNSSDSKIAMIHELTALRGGNMMQHQPHSQNNQSFRFSNNTLMDREAAVPMRFGWDRTATVDGVSEDIIATTDGTIFALSLPQGVIDYDPSIGFDPQLIDDIENELYELLNTREFIDTINSPTFKGIFIAIILVFGIIAISYYMRKYNQ